MNIHQKRPLEQQHRAPACMPLSDFLVSTHRELLHENQGVVADYIPELKKADPRHFGIALTTADGHVYEVGDSAVPFTIQSISKAFVFAMALDLLGHERVEAVIGVEPSGDAFNSIRLRSDNRPFNAMVNSGAIACSGLIYDLEGRGAAERIRETLGQFAGRELDVDEAVFESERLTGDRNRAIAFLLRNYGVIKGDVDQVLDVYFRQCSVRVTARDLAVMAATLANCGVNPVNGQRVIGPYAVSRMLSVMTSSGMYDAGEWIRASHFELAHAQAHQRAPWSPIFNAGQIFRGYAVDGMSICAQSKVNRRHRGAAGFQYRSDFLRLTPSLTQRRRIASRSCPTAARRRARDQDARPCGTRCPRARCR